MGKLHSKSQYSPSSFHQGVVSQTLHCAPKNSPPEEECQRCLCADKVVNFNALVKSLTLKQLFQLLIRIVKLLRKDLAVSARFGVAVIAGIDGLRAEDWAEI